MPRNHNNKNPVAPEWLPLADEKVRHVWANSSGTSEGVVSPSFYAENGTPIDGDTGDDMVYVRTEVSSDVAEAIKFRGRVEPLIQRIYDVLYFDDESNAYRPDKERGSAAEIVEFVDDLIREVYSVPKRGARKRPPINLDA